MKIAESQFSETVLVDVQSKIRAKYNYKSNNKKLKAQQSVSS